MTRRVSEGLERCKLYVRYGVGLDSIDVPAATDNDIVVAYFPDYCQDEVANHTIMLLLASAKKLSLLDRTMRTGRWRPGGFGVMGPITGETLGLVGFGNIAREVVPRAQALGLQLIGCDPYIPDEPFTALGVERVESLDELLARSDYVSIHTPLTAETRHHFGRDQFGKMKPSAYLLNTSRGPVIDEEALVEALQEGQIAGGWTGRLRTRAASGRLPPAADGQRGPDAPQRGLLESGESPTSGAGSGKRASTSCKGVGRVPLQTRE